MPDLILHRLPFGGFALEPASMAGLDFVRAAWNDSGRVYKQPDACMAGLPHDALGFEPDAFDDLAEDALIAGLTMEAVA